MTAVLIMSLIVYICMIFFIRYRTAIAIVGSGAILLYGSITNVFPADEAFRKFPVEIVILIVVLSIFSKIFENEGVFDYIGDKFYQISKGKKILIAIMLPVTIYATSLFMNNLSVILLFTFICVQLAVRMRLPIIPMLVSAVIASNIGGAPLPWADTPAVVITLYSDFNLFDFLTKLFIPCAVYCALLVWYTVRWFKKNDMDIDSHGKMNKIHDTLNHKTDHEKQEHKPGPGPLGEKHPHVIPPPPPHKLSLQYKENLNSDEICEKHELKVKQQGKKLVTYFGRRTFKFRLMKDIIYEDMLSSLDEIKPLKRGNYPPTHDGLAHLTWNAPDEESLMFDDIFEVAGLKLYRGEPNEHLQKPDFKFKNILRPVVMFVLLIAGICVAPFFNISIAYVSLFFGGLMLALNKGNPEDLLNSLVILDSIMFIATLFLIAGAIESSGILKTIVDYMLNFTGGNKLIIVLFIMLAAFIIATFLSAGPAAATLLPICLQLSDAVGNRLVYAALALGILAGSSMLPWSATGGPVMLGEVNRFLGQLKAPPHEMNRIREIFSLKSYIKFSIPFSLLMVVLSALFLFFYLTVIMGQKVF